MKNKLSKNNQPFKYKNPSEIKNTFFKSKYIKRSICNIIFIILILSLFNCFTVYTKDEEVLDSKKIDTKNTKEQKDIFILTHTLTREGLYLLLDGYKVEEEKQIFYILETYKENKAIKLNFELEELARCGDKYVCGAVFVIAGTILLLELPTLPLRTMSETKERIQKETKTTQSNKIGIVSTENISFVMRDRITSPKIPFQEDKIIIPFAELELDSFTMKKFPYKIFYTKTGKTILSGILDFSKQINADSEMKLIVEENTKKKESAKCKSEFPMLVHQDLEEHIAMRQTMELCKEKYLSLKNLIENNTQYKECLERTKSCYKITRHID